LNSEGTRRETKLRELRARGLQLPTYDDAVRYPKAYAIKPTP